MKDVSADSRANTLRGEDSLNALRAKVNVFAKGR